MLEVLNQYKNNRSIEIIQSKVAWTVLHQWLAKILDVYPTSLQAQYWLSTEPKALPFNLANENDLKMMLTLVKPLVVPPLLANGRRSTRKMKPVTVQVFNKNEAITAVAAEKV
jgi:hypothetical protein